MALESQENKGHAKKRTGRVGLPPDDVFDIFCISIIWFTEQGTVGHTASAEIQHHVGAH